MEKQKTSAYYQNRAVHCLAPAQSATVHSPHNNNNNNNNNVNDQDKPFSVISEFDTWRKHPDLAEAVAAVIRSSKASTMMQVEIQLKKASDTLNFARLYPLDQKDLAPALCPVDFGVPIPSKVKAPVERKIPNFSKYRLFSRDKTLNPALLGGGKSHRF